MCNDVYDQEKKLNLIHFNVKPFQRIQEWNCSKKELVK